MRTVRTCSRSKWRRARPTGLTWREGTRAAAPCGTRYCAGSSIRRAHGGTRKSRLETKSENEARSALLARLWCHLILQNPANRAENLTRLCSATIGQTGWRRERDSNPRTFRSTVFKTAAFDHSAIPPARGIIVAPNPQREIEPWAFPPSCGGLPTSVKAAPGRLFHRTCSLSTTCGHPPGVVAI